MSVLYDDGLYMGVYEGSRSVGFVSCKISHDWVDMPFGRRRA